MKPEFLKYLGKKVKSKEPFAATYIDLKGRFYSYTLTAHLLWFGKTEEYPTDQWFLDVSELKEDALWGPNWTLAVNDMGVTDAELMEGLQ